MIPRAFHQHLAHVPRWVVEPLRSFERTDLMTTSLEALARYKLRTALSVLGVVLGVAAVIAMISVSDGGRLEALRQVESLGLNNVILRRVGPRDSGGLLLRDVETVRALVPTVVAASALVERVQLISGPLTSRPTRVLGIGAEFGRALELRISRGRFLTPLDEQLDARVGVLGDGLSRDLFGYRDPVGQQVRAGGEWYTVVGVLERRSMAAATGTTLSRDLNQTVLVPVSGVLGTRFALRSTQSIDELWIHLRDGQRVAELGRIIENTLGRLRGGGTTPRVVIPLELLNQRIRTQRTFSIIIGSVAVLSLLVGGIGIMNIMLASVLERTKEIGIRRMAGATRRNVTLQFLTESILMTLCGGTIGIIGGVIVSYAITAYAEWQTHISLGSVLLAFGVSSLVGLVFGLYPALKAARLEPIDAIRYE